MLQRLKNYFKELNMKHCSACGCKETTSEVTDKVENIVCEEKVSCSQCGRQVNYWAYGFYEKPTTYTGELSLWIVNLHESYRRKRFGNVAQNPFAKKSK